jgi:hypothetical protein
MRYNAWVEGGIVDGRLIFPTGGDEVQAIRELLKRGDKAAGAVTIIAAVTVAVSIGDVRRYLNIRRM